MPTILYQDFNILEANEITIEKSLKLKNVKINDGDNHLEIQDNNGKKIFWVNNEGCSIKAVDKSIELEDVIGFPSICDGILSVSNDELSFSRDLNLDKLDVINSSIENLKVDNLKLNSLTLQSLSADHLLNKILNSDKINSDEANIKNITNEKLSSQEITSEHINSDTLKVKLFNPEEVKTKSILSEEGNIKSFQAEQAGISKLECSSIMSHNLDIIETANIKVLNNEEAHIADLNVCNAEIQILKVNKIIKSVTEHGSSLEPLKLNMIDNSSLDCNNDENDIKIYNKIVDKTPQNKFELINLPEGDYRVITKSHNQFINVNYNMCMVDGKKWLFTKFEGIPLNLVVEIILEKL
tara:strand:+ start:471 stop:1532 length:1062 start_codon:yes stop_codon:yes gene_type:complete